MGEARLDVSRAARSWLVLHAGALTRRYSSAIAAQRWVIARTGAEGRITLLDGALVAGALVTFDPVVSVSGTRRPNMSIGASTSLSYRAGRLSVRLAQSLERADFPSRDGEPRLEQLSMLSLGNGLATTVVGARRPQDAGQRSFLAAQDTRPTALGGRRRPPTRYSHPAEPGRSRRE